MIEYIRRSLAEEAIEEYVCRRCEEYNELAGGCISHAMHCPHLSGEEILKPVENENVQPAKRGEWVCVNEDETVFMCTNCGGEVQFEVGCPKEFLYKYCMYCGAIMEGEKNG